MWHKPTDCSVGVEPILNSISLPTDISSPYLHQMIRKAIFEYVTHNFWQLHKRTENHFVIFHLKIPINAKPSRNNYTFDIFRLNLCKLASWKVNTLLFVTNWIYKIVYDRTRFSSIFQLPRWFFKNSVWVHMSTEFIDLLKKVFWINSYWWICFRCCLIWKILGNVDLIKAT